MRQRIRADLQRRRDERRRRKAERTAKSEARTGERGKGHEPDPRGKAKLARVVRYGAFSLIAAWSLLALAIYAVLGTVAGWIAALGLAEGWIAWCGQLVGQAGGSIVAILWLAGTLVILGAMAAIRRLAA